MGLTDETGMTTGRLTRRRRQFLAALVCLDTGLVVDVVTRRDRAAAVRLLTAHAPDVPVIACDLFSGCKSPADTTGAIVVADPFRLVRLALQVLDEVRWRRKQQIHGHGRKDETLFRLRRVLRVAQQRLDPHTLEWDADTDDEVAAAWHTVDLLRRVYAAPDRDTAHRRLVTFSRVGGQRRDPRSHAAGHDHRHLAGRGARVLRHPSHQRGHQSESAKIKLKGRPPSRPWLPKPRQLPRPHPPPRRPAM